MEKIKISYQFVVENMPTQIYDLEFSEPTMTLMNEKPSTDEWTRLENKKCSHCPLDKTTHPHCPIAQNLASVASHFAQEKSYKEATIVVITQERSYEKTAGLQEGLHGIFGLIMATSGCPHMNFLKPMARFHLPFATHVETMVRSLSFYLLKKYFSMRDKSIVFDLKELDDNYAKVSVINQMMSERICAISKGDADHNAISILNTFASLLQLEISGDLSEIKKTIGY